MELSFIGKPEGEKFKSIFKSTLYNEKPELNHGSIRVLTGGDGHFAFEHIRVLRVAYLTWAYPRNSFVY